MKKIYKTEKDSKLHQCPSNTSLSCLSDCSSNNRISQSALQIGHPFPFQKLWGCANNGLENNANIFGQAQSDGLVLPQKPDEVSLRPVMWTSYNLLLKDDIKIFVEGLILPMDKCSKVS